MKRYENYYGELMESSSGDWVRYEDAIAAVAQERERWRETVIRAAAYANHYGREGFFVTCSPDASSQVLTWALNPKPPETGREPKA